MNDMDEEAVVEVEFFQHLLQIKIFTYIPRLIPFDLGPRKFILCWRYNQLHVVINFTYFHFTTFNRIKEHWYDS